MKKVSFEKISREKIIPFEVETLDNGEFLVTCPQVPEVLAQGRTIAEAIEIAQDVTRRLIESYQDHGDLLPKGLSKLLKEPIKKKRQIQIPIWVESFAA